MAWKPPLGNYDSYRIGRREVTRSEYKRHTKHQRNGALARGRGVRARKTAILWAFPLTGCEHEYSYHEDVIGDYGVINGTYTERWLECDNCGDRKAASHDDAPSYDDY
jgi:hypothetical protein